ncbi:hypothetical protein U1Q18_014109, partial [Sarracenia purpurea var. burkii]
AVSPIIQSLSNCFREPKSQIEMGSDSGGEESNHIILVWEVKKDRLASMLQKISCTPRLLSKTAGHSDCCIFRVPQSLIDTNGGAYQPHIVSIGPFHHGKPHLQMIEEHKWRFLGALLNRTQTKLGLGLDDYLKAIQPLEMKAREFYSETVTEILVLDGCFIIELFRKIGKLVPFDPDDPLISMSWVYSFLLRDFIRLENQIPFFILQRLFDLTAIPGEESDQSFTKLALEFFNYATQRPDDVIKKYSKYQGRHLLDLLRSSFIPPAEHEEPKPGNPPPPHVIHCISKLRRAGINLKPSKEDSFLVVSVGKYWRKTHSCSCSGISEKYINILLINFNNYMK